MSTALAHHFSKKPKILISPLLYAVIIKTKDTSDIVYYKGLSIVIHEMTHYFQSVDDLRIYKDAQQLGSLKNTLSNHLRCKVGQLDSWFGFLFADL